MKVRDIMTDQVITVSPGESVETAARMLTHYNIGILPVCSENGALRGLVTDRDLVTRCLASNRNPAKTTVREIMTDSVLAVQPDMEAGVAAHMMGRQQVRRLPVVSDGKICGMVSLGDLALREENALDAADALADISENVRRTP